MVHSWITAGSSPFFDLSREKAEATRGVCPRGVAGPALETVYSKTMHHTYTVHTCSMHSIQIYIISFHVHLLSSQFVVAEAYIQCIYISFDSFGHRRDDY